MATHVFEVKYGYLNHWGEFVRETESFVFVKDRYRNKERRRSKTRGMLYIECDDPKKLVALFQQEWEKHSNFVEEARNKLKGAEDYQKSAALAAIRGW